MNLREHYPLQSCNTLRLQQQARYCVDVTSETELQQASQWAAERKLPVYILGEGSNVIISRDIDGLVVLNRLQGIRVVARDADTVTINVAAGENWHNVVTHTLSQHWYGLENLALIPGTAGAAPVQNIGAYGVEIRQFVVQVRAWDRQQQAWQNFSNADCQFAYRDSIFKHAPQRYLISSAQLRLQRRPQVNTSYSALREWLQQHRIDADCATPQQVFDAVVAIRRERLPDPAQLPNVGSFFKNPVIPMAVYRQLLERFPALVSYPAGEQQRKLAAAWLIDQAGWKGRRCGTVVVHDRQALVLVNAGGATGADVLQLADDIRRDIHSRYGVELELEPAVL